YAWVTLATNDSYSLGALVLGHSLRRVDTPHDLVVLVTPGVSAAMRNQLSSVFTVVQEVNVLDSQDEANLALLERPELGITFTKLHCWRLTQYEKCVFLDADTLASVLKNSDELFEREELSAAPDPGWPDCFNSGVFVYRPSLDTFNNLIKFAVSKGSFDGGDQGLLNLYFSDWATKDITRHLPFLYNMVSTATYSYLPAYKAFGEGAKIAHFIGPNKPWLQYFDPETRLVRPPQGSEHLQYLLQLWWDIFCSTVHPSLSPDMAHCSSNETQAGPASQTVSHFSIDLFQKFQPMSIYSDYQPISVSPYVEDLSLSFWDPWENYEEHSKDTKYNDRSSHTTLWNYHGSEQQHRAFENDKRQSGWQRYTDRYQGTQHNVMSSAETFHTQPHHSNLSGHNNASIQSPQYHPQQSHERLVPHQSYQHSHLEHHHHRTEPHYHHESHYQPELHTHHQVPHHHEPHNQTEMHAQKPHYHHEPQRQAEHHRHEPHNQPEPHYQELQYHNKPHNDIQQHHQQHYHLKSHHPETHYEQQHHGEQHHDTDRREHHNHHESHNQQHYHWHNSSQHQHHNQDHQHECHEHHDTQHQQDMQHGSTVHDKETHQVYTISSAPWEGQNQQHRHGDHQDHQAHPDPPPPASYISSTVNNSKYIKVTNEPHCLVAQPALEVESSKAADNDLGLAGALAQVTLGVPRSAEQTALEEHVRRQAWEQGSMDYMGRDSFDNIWRKITETLAQAPPRPVPQKAVTAEITTTQPTSEPTLPEPKPTTLPPTGAGDAPVITSTTSPPLQPTLDSETLPPKSTDPFVPSVPLGGLTPSPSPGEQPVPHTPSVTEATPPTSPPIVVPTADSKALKVDVEPLETPPVGSTPTKFVSEEQVPSPTRQVTQASESRLQTEAASVVQQGDVSAVCKELGPVQEMKAPEQEKVRSSPQQTVPTQGVPEALVPSETKSSEALLASQQTLPAQESPVAPSTPQPSPIPEAPVTPSILQEPPTQESPASLPSVTPPQESLVVPVALSTPEQSPVPGVPVTPAVPQVPPTQEGPVVQSTSQPTPTPESSVTPVILSTSEPPPIPEVPLTSSIQEVSPTQESPSAAVPLSTPEPTVMQESPGAPPTPQETSTQDVPAVPVLPQQPSSAQDALVAPVSKSVEQKEPTSVQQQLPPTPPASPGTVETKPTKALSEKTEVKPAEQKESPLAPVPIEQPKVSTLLQTQEAVQQKVTASAPPLLPSQKVPVSTTTDETPAISETKPVEETPFPQLSVIKDQAVAAPVPPAPVPLPSAETETVPLAVPVPTESASETPPSPVPLSKSKESPKASSVAEPVHGEATPTVPSKTESSFVRDAPEREAEIKPAGGKGATVSPTQPKPAEPSKPVPSKPVCPPSTLDPSSSDQASVPSAQSKPEEPSKSEPSKPPAPASPPTTEDASPSDQAPVPPKRRGHKAAGTSTPDQGAASKPVAQSQQGKGSKQVQKGKK
ncbi:hypothetical protein Cfor_00819, partial [Coptotermes formosanus]